MAQGIEWEAMMKVYLKPEDWMSLGIKRVANALAAFKPDWATLVATEEEADLQIVHMVGNGQRQHWLEPKRDYAVVQYCLRTTELPNTKDWLSVWAGAKVVWSYYDLIAKMREDQSFDPRINVYHAPLGVNGNVFKPAALTRKNFAIGTSGRVPETEAVREAYAACQAVGKSMLHLGPNFELGPDVVYVDNVSDAVLASFWAQCNYVAGLRAIEGFELPVLEGLMCGARPIIYDAPHYTHWFGEFSEIIPEGTSEEVTESLRAILSGRTRPVTAAERSQVAQTFDWKKIAEGYWEAIR